jgi:hypothetical protein
MNFVCDRIVDSIIETIKNILYKVLLFQNVIALVKSITFKLKIININIYIYIYIYILVIIISI